MVIFVIRYDGVFQSSCLSYDWCTQITDRNQLAESARFKKTRHDEEITRSIDPSGEWFTEADCDVDFPGEMLFKRPEIPLIFSVTGPKNDSLNVGFEKFMNDVPDEIQPFLGYKPCDNGVHWYMFIHFESKCLLHGSLIHQFGGA